MIISLNCVGACFREGEARFRQEAQVVRVKLPVYGFCSIPTDRNAGLDDLKGCSLKFGAGLLAGGRGYLGAAWRQYGQGRAPGHFFLDFPVLLL